MTRLLIAALLGMAGLMCGCGDMPNDEVIRETKKCQDAGMEARAYGYGGVQKISCIPKEPAR